MGRSRKKDRERQSTLKDICEISRVTAENTGQTNEKLDDLKEGSRTIADHAERANEKLDAIKSDTEKMNKSKIALYSLIVAVITLIVTVIGMADDGIIARWKAGAEPTSASNAESEVETEAEPEPEKETAAEAQQEPDALEPEYQIYLYSEYNTTIHVNVETDMTATLNFETDAVTITAYLESGEVVEMPLEEKNAAEWQKKVVFDEVGVHEIVASAMAPNGEVIKDSIKVEVIPYTISDEEKQIFHEVFNSLVETFQAETN